MAKFTDQFDRHPPNYSLPSIAIPTWPTLIRNEALILLSDFDDAMLIDMGVVLENMIAIAAQPFNFPVAKDAVIWTRIEPHWVSPTFAPKSSNEIRDTFGDLNIFLCQCEAPDEWELEYKFAFAPKVDRWHLLAVLALWKLVDCSDVMLGRAAHTISGMIPKNLDIRFQNAAGIAMEAQAACQIAIQLKERERHLQEMGVLRDAQEKQVRKDIAKKGGDAKNQKYEPYRMEAIRLATTRSFESQDEEAAWISDKLEYAPNKFVPMSTVKTWLRKHRKTA